MNITRENIDELNAVVKVKVEKADYSEKVEGQLKDYRKKATIKGFRPGMAPMGMIRKMYGKSILLDEVNKIISDSLTKHLADEKTKILGEPLPSLSENSALDFDKDEDFEFAFDLGLEPQYELKLSKRDKVPYYSIVVDDKMIEEVSNGHSSRFGKTEEVDVVVEKDIVKGKFEQLDTEGNVLEGGVATEDATFAVDKVEEESVRSLVLGAKKDDIVDFDIKKAFPGGADLASMLRIDKEEAEILEGNFRFTVQSISRHFPAEVNQELYNQAYGEGVVNSEEEYKAKITEEIQTSFVQQADYRFTIDAKEKFVAKVGMSLPDAFLKRWLVTVNKELTAESIENDYDNMKTDLSWQLIKNKITEEQDIKVSEEELIAFAKQATLMQFQQYGLMNLPDEQLETYAMQMLSNEDEKRKMWDRKQEEKIVEYLKGAVKLDPKDVTADEFNALFTK